MPTDSNQTCMAQQFHNGLLLDYEGMMKGELGRLWDGKLHVKASEDIVIALFEDDSWYIRVGKEEPAYLIAKDDEELAANLLRPRRIHQRQADDVLWMIMEWAREEDVKFMNKMSGR